jgi:hypothetical protein
VKTAWILPAALLGSIFGFQSSETPRAVPVTGEFHHHLKMENSYVRVFYVEVAPHEDTLLHEHAVDYLFASIGPADVTNAVLGKPDVHLVLKDGETHFTRGGFAHVARNLSDQPFRNVTIELLHPQGQPRNLCEKVDASAQPGSCFVERRANSFTISPWFETDEIRVENIELQPKASFQHVPGAESLLVALEQADLTVRSEGKTEAKLSGSDVLWLPRRTLQVFGNAGERPSRFLLIHFKDSAAGVKH